MITHFFNYVSNKNQQKIIYKINVKLLDNLFLISISKVDYLNQN